MESKVLINLNWHREVIITVESRVPNDVREPDSDVRDRMVHMFLQDAAPAGVVDDGFAFVRKMYDENGKRYFEVVPIHPIEMPKYIDLIRQNADKLKVEDTNPLVPGYPTVGPSY